MNEYSTTFFLLLLLTHRGLSLPGPHTHSSCPKPTFLPFSFSPLSIPLPYPPYPPFQGVGKGRGLRERLPIPSLHSRLEAGETCRFVGISIAPRGGLCLSVHKENEIQGLANKPHYLPVDLTGLGSKMSWIPLCFHSPTI